MIIGENVSEQEKLFPEDTSAWHGRIKQIPAYCISNSNQHLSEAPPRLEREGRGLRRKVWAKSEHQSFGFLDKRLLQVLVSYS